MRQFSDEDLTAFLDGEAEPQLADAIETALLEDAEVSDRMTSLDLDKGELKGAFDALLSVAPEAPEAVSVPPLKPQANFGFLKMAAAVALAIGLGWAIGQNRSDLNDWQDYAAAYHKLYVDETLQPTGFSPDTLAAQVAMVSTAVGLEISPEFLKDVAGLELRRSQVLGFEGAAIAHIAFQSETGAPIALCITTGSDAESLNMAEVKGMSSARWSKGGFEYLLIGGDDPALIERAAAHFAAL